MLRAAWVGCLVTLALGGCATEEPDLAEELGFSEVPIEWPPGYVSFYSGGSVLAEVALTGGFEPRPDAYYFMIRVPQSTVDNVLESGSPVTIPLCHPAADVTLFANEVSDIFHADDPGSINCTPEVQHYEGRMTIEYHSGPGLDGGAQIGLRENGELFAGASAYAHFPSACEGDNSVGNSSMHIGHWLLDDEIPTGCTPPPDGP